MEVEAVTVIAGHCRDKHLVGKGEGVGEEEGEVEREGSCHWYSGTLGYLQRYKFSMGGGGGGGSCYWYCGTLGYLQRYTFSKGMEGEGMGKWEGKGVLSTVLYSFVSGGIFSL